MVLTAEALAKVPTSLAPHGLTEKVLEELTDLSTWLATPHLHANAKTFAIDRLEAQRVVVSARGLARKKGGFEAIEGIEDLTYLDRIEEMAHLDHVTLERL